jgi:hypothetical protein
MDLIDEKDDLTLCLFYFLEDGFQSLFEVPSVLGTSHERAHIEFDKFLILEGLWYITFDDSLCKKFYDSSLADSGISYEDRIILGPTRENLHRTSQLIITTDDRV